MVNSRQALKNSMEQHLQKNIHLAKEMLGDLRDAVQQVENNSAAAKGDVYQTVDVIQQLLISRKLELTRQIDLLCRTQINSLQEEIQQTYIALGSLQSTLTNLDSFDHGQLLNLSIHELSLAPNLHATTPLELNVDATTLVSELEQWGSVNVKGLKGLIDVGTSASMPQRFVDYNDKKSDQELMCHKSVSSEPASVFTFTRQPKLPNASASNSWDKVVVPEDSNTPEKWHVEQWLTEIKSQSCPENEDFELVSVDNLSSEKDVTSDKVLNTLENDNGNKSVTDGDSSIICLEKDDETINDLSKWLKPKKNNQDVSHIGAPIAEVRPISSSITENFHNPMNNRFVDFPCLRVDHKYWIPSKKAKSSFCGLSEKEIIPPTYALPAPFWLKKYH